MISFVIPAHNEEACLGPTLRAIESAMAEIRQPHERIVVDDASTDRTAAIAREQGARVVTVQYRQIAATRNAGARAARGDWFFFIDADTLVDPAVIREALRALERGAAGGGAWTRLDGRVPLYARLLWWSLIAMGHLIGFTGGACMFCTRAAFEAGGGFDEAYFGGEEWKTALAIKRAGPFFVLRRRALTSGRRFRRVAGLTMLALPWRLLFPGRTLRRRETVQDIWYDSNRADDDAPVPTWRERLSNAFALLVITIIAAPPLWWVAAAAWPEATAGPMGTVRRICEGTAVHAGLLCWVLFAVCARAVTGQTRRMEQLRFVLLASLALGLAVRATLVAAALWRGWLGG